MNNDILVIPDPHDEPEVPKDRFRWLGRLIADRQPGNIVCLGDGTSLDSLSSYDKGTVHAEGKRYSDDIASFHEALDEIEYPVERLNKRLVKMHKKKYDPRKVYCLGNHEQRIITAVNTDPKLIGTMSLEDLGLYERGWEVYGLTEPVSIEGIAFAHYFTSGIMGKPISGINHARSLVAKTYVSSVVGHSHDRSFWEDTNVFGQKIIGLVAGCYFTHKLKYTREERRNWPGLTYIRVEGNHINPEFISMERIEEEYS